MNISETDILAALDELGRTPDEVAASLHKSHIKGNRRCEASCPLAIYLNQKFEKPDGTFCVWRNSVGTAGPQREPILFSYAFMGFVDKFDDGQYPELIEGNDHEHR